jgi:enamine deaminase RidA (YjgF/YER057c/UK114 family)
MQLESRSITGSKAVELYLTAIPGPAVGADGEAEQVFGAIVGEAARCGGRVCQLRAFVPEGRLEAYQRAWQAAFGQGQAECPCNWLQAGPSVPGGVQAHVIAAPVEWKPLRDRRGAQAGWLCSNGKTSWAIVGGLCLPRSADDAASTQEAFEAAEALLAQAGMGLGDVARTWFFLDDILGWYDRFNVGRSQVFRRRGLLGPAQGGGVNVPASTGIGVSPAGGARLAMDLLAVRGEKGCVLRHPAAGKQRCAYEYGSAFARSAEAATLGGRTVYVSGTAAIDVQGKSCFAGDAGSQIRMTLENVLAVLSDMRCGAENVVQAMAYCKTPAVAARFIESFQRTLSWPWVVVVGDVCRADLVFEAEVTACQPANG